MLAYGFDAHESGGALRFVMRGGGRAVELDPDALVVESDGDAPYELARAPESEALREVRVSYLRADADYLQGAEEIHAPEGGAEGVTGSDLPLALGRSEAKAIAERWAQESGVGRETARLVLPPSLLSVEPGDAVRLGGATYRVDRIEDGLARRVEATRIDPAIYALRTATEEDGTAPGAPLPGETAPTPPAWRLLDLPYARFGGGEAEAHAAIWSANWPGSVSAFASDRDEDYARIARLTRPSTVARLMEPLPAAAPWRWSRGVSVRAKALSGELRSADELAVLNGANLAALAAEDGRWELLQFREAKLVGQGEYLLSDFLRGLGGTEPLIGDPAPEGAVLVLLGGPLASFDPGPRGLERHYRLGPTLRSLNDESYAHGVWTWEGAGLRPLAPVHPAGGAPGERRPRAELDAAGAARSRRLAGRRDAAGRGLGTVSPAAARRRGGRAAPGRAGDAGLPLHRRHAGGGRGGRSVRGGADLGELRSRV